MGRMAEQYQEQCEQENLSGMADYLHHVYCMTGSTIETKEFKNEHISTNTRRIGHRQNNEPTQHEVGNNSTNSSGEEAPSVPF